MWLDDKDGDWSIHRDNLCIFSPKIRPIHLLSLKCLHLPQYSNLRVKKHVWKQVLIVGPKLAWHVSDVDVGCRLFTFINTVSGEDKMSVCVCVSASAAVVYRSWVFQLQTTAVSQLWKICPSLCIMSLSCPLSLFTSSWVSKSKQFDLTVSHH